MNILKTIRDLHPSDQPVIIEDEQGNELSSFEIVSHSYESQLAVLQKAYDDQASLVRDFDRIDVELELKLRACEAVISKGEGDDDLLNEQMILRTKREKNESTFLTKSVKLVKGIERASQDVLTAHDRYLDEAAVLIVKADDEKQKKVKKVMDEWKNGKLKSSSGDKVVNHKQAIAIALSEAGLSKGGLGSGRHKTGDTVNVDLSDTKAQDSDIEIITEDELTKAIDLSKLVKKIVQVKGKDGLTYMAARWVDPATGQSVVTQSGGTFYQSDEAAVKDIEAIVSSNGGINGKIHGLIAAGIYDNKSLITLSGGSYMDVYKITKGLVTKKGDQPSEPTTPVEPGAPQPVVPVSPQPEVNAKKIEQVMHQARSINRSKSGVTYKDFWRNYREVLNEIMITGYPKSLIAYGTGGLGKTYDLNEVMRNNKIRVYDDEIDPSSDQYDAVIIKGSTGIRDMWNIIVKNKGKLIVFDDCDSMWSEGDENKQNILKGMLDTSGDGTVRYGQAGKDEDGNNLPKQIRFTGQVVFISNLKRSEFPQPLIDSRCASVDLTMTKAETMDKLSEIKDKIELRGKNDVLIEVPQESRTAAYNFFERHKDVLGLGQINARTFAQVAQIHNLQAKNRTAENFENSAMIRMNLV